MSDFGEVRYPKRSALAQRIAVMGYLFGLARQIDPRLKYTMDVSTLIGLLYIAKCSFSLFGSIINGLRVHLISRLWKLDLKAKYGQWVVITGATDGVGLEYAREFAKRKHSLILLGRNEAKLEKVKNELKQLIHERNILTICCDFEKATIEDYKDIADKIDSSKREIGILINNAGVMYRSPNKLLDQSKKDDWAQVSVNCTATVLVTRACLSGMVKRRKGLIINLSSTAAYRPLPLMGVYSASKKFVEYFSSTLQTEYAKDNIDVQLLTPNYISTKMTKWSNVLQGSNFIFPDAKSFVDNAVATIGRSKETAGYWSHDLQLFFYRWFVPDFMYTLSGWYLLKGVDSSRKFN